DPGRGAGAGAGETLDGAPVRVRGSGWFARCLQHECDHLDGGLYVDRVVGWRRRKVMWQVGRAAWAR
ncbi:peptide deformylase, partial [Streptomyces apricus]